MNTKNSNGKEGIDSRTRKAAKESMTIVALGAGEFKVYSGVKNAYVVNLIKETCECPDSEYNHSADECKHRQRVEMELGERPIPDLGGRTDVELMTGRSRETEPAVATDGGAVVDDTPQGSADEITHACGCDNPECEGIDADADRPLLSFACWDEWAAYDEQQRIEEVRCGNSPYSILYGKFP